MIPVVEQPTLIDCGGLTMHGVLAQPARRRDVAVVFVVGGPQYRAGSHRQFVLLARAFAQAGYPTLRFDVRGMGDSDGARQSFEDLAVDIDAAITAACAAAGVQRVVLWGLCDGASASLLYLQQRDDHRIAGLMLANPWVRSDESLARTQLRHYYTRRVLDPAFWLEVLRGRVTRQAFGDLARNLSLSASALLRRGREPVTPSGGDFRRRMAAAWSGFRGPIMLLLSGDDYTAKEFVGHASADRTWQGTLTRSGLQRHDLPGVDHTFSSRSGLQTVTRLCINWLDSQFAQRP